MTYQQVVHNTLIGSGGHAISLSTLFKANGIEINNIVSNEISQHWAYCRFFKSDYEFQSVVPPERALMYLGIVGEPGSKLKRKLIIFFTGYTFPNIISPHSILFSEITENMGIQIFHHVIINENVKIGAHAVINNSSVIEHDVIIGENVHLAPGAIVCGNVIIGNDVFIGAGAVIKNGVSITSNTIIGMGAVVINDIKTPGTYIGSPAKRLDS